jgi:nitroimidazol reductase NimA-like FMN-containing flavoprotein (pyridoxamine 5'-phosphate oxidase superfamily)
MTIDSGSGIVLDPSECWLLLRSTRIGRLAIAVAHQPDIFPVNFLVDHASAVFRTAEGSKLAAVVTNPPVAFEADRYDSAADEVWSVVVTGRAERIVKPEELLETAALPLFPWHAGPKHHLVRIVPTSISGRRFHVADAALWRNEFTDGPHAPLE